MDFENGVKQGDGDWINPRGQSYFYGKFEQAIRGWALLLSQRYPRRKDCQGYYLDFGDGNKWFYPIRCFEILAEYREKQIDSIINDWEIYLH